MVEHWKTALTNYFYNAASVRKSARLGVEVEHFILDSNGNAVDYSGEKGVKRVLQKLMEVYPEAKVLPDDDFFGFSVSDFNITLEPAAQLEISIAPFEDICKIGEVYLDFLTHLQPILDEMGYQLCNAGCQPYSNPESLELIPKRRYALMDDYFSTSGTGGKEMMRGTASLQVSVDYESESDFRSKVQAAYFYSPVLKLLCDNADFYKGKKQNRYLKRTDIWRRVDPVRCGILPGVMSVNYGFDNYTAFIGNIPPIFLKLDTNIISTQEKTVAELFKDMPMTEQDIVHILSMAFPDVRLKQFLEIRFADSVSLNYILAYCALIKGLLYSQEGLSFASKLIQTLRLSERDVINAENSLAQSGYNGIIYGVSVKEMIQDILEIAERNLPDGEKQYLMGFRDLLQQNYERN